MMRRFLCLLALAALLAILPTIASAQNTTEIWIDGTLFFEAIVSNMPITNATVNGSGPDFYNPNNRYDRYFPSESLLGLYNDRRGTIINAAVNGGVLQNFGAITSATVNGGFLTNGCTGSGGPTGPVIISSIGTIASVTVNGGLFENYAIVTNATVNFGGCVENVRSVRWGYGTFNNVTLNGGIVGNSGRIDELTYISGTYFGQSPPRSAPGNEDFGVIYYGTIGTLNLLDVKTNFDSNELMYAITQGKVGTLGTVIVNYGGTFNNIGGMTIANATVNGGRLDNYGGIIDATVNGGQLWSQDGSTINDATLRR